MYINKGRRRANFRRQAQPPYLYLTHKILSKRVTFAVGMHRLPLLVGCLSLEYTYIGTILLGFLCLLLPYRAKCMQCLNVLPLLSWGGVVSSTLFLHCESVLPFTPSGCSLYNKLFYNYNCVWGSI